MTELSTEEKLVRTAQYLAMADEEIDGAVDVLHAYLNGQAQEDELLMLQEALLDEQRARQGRSV